MLSLLAFLIITFYKIIVLKKKNQFETIVVLKNFARHIYDYFTKKRIALFVSILFFYLFIDKIIFTIAVIFSEDITPLFFNFHFINSNSSLIENFKYEIILLIFLIIVIIKIINKKNIYIKISIIFYIISYFLVQSLKFKIVGITNYSMSFPISYFISKYLFQPIENVNIILHYVLWYINMFFLIISVISIQNIIANNIVSKIMNDTDLKNKIS